MRVVVDIQSWLFVLHNWPLTSTYPAGTSLLQTNYLLCSELKVCFPSIICSDVSECSTGLFTKWTSIWSCLSSFIKACSKTPTLSNSKIPYSTQNPLFIISTHPKLWMGSVICNMSFILSSFLANSKCLIRFSSVCELIDVVLLALALAICWERCQLGQGIPL